MKVKADLNNVDIERTILGHVLITELDYRTIYHTTLSCDRFSICIYHSQGAVGVGGGGGADLDLVSSCGKFRQKVIE